MIMWYQSSMSKVKIFISKYLSLIQNTKKLNESKNEIISLLINLYKNSHCPQYIYIYHIANKVSYCNFYYKTNQKDLSL